MAIQLAELFAQVGAEVAAGSATAAQKIELQIDPRRAGQTGKPLIAGSAVPGER